MPTISPIDPMTEEGEEPARRVRLPRRYEHLDEEEFHLLVSELQDETTRSRMREALWISIIVHMVVLFLIGAAPKFLPRHAVTLASPQDLDKKQLTYLDLPPDLQKVKPPINTDKISDQNRIAQARQPNRKLLDQLRDNRRMGAPSPAPQQPQQQQQVPQPQQQQATQQQQQQAQQQRGGGQPQTQRTSQTAEMEQPEQASPRDIFKAQQGSAGTLIQQAAHSSAMSHGRGNAGSFGSGRAVPNTNLQGGVDILSDTMGVDFGPYLQRVKFAVQENWYTVIPEEARAPLRKDGRVVVEFMILPNGAVSEMKLVGPSGDVALDRASWAGITMSNPLPPLPKEFKGPFLALRFYFYYNPDKGEMR